jgi:hypothetical protein
MMARAAVSKLSITIADFRPLNKNALRGLATIRIAALRLEIRDVAVHQRDDARWAALPARPQLDRNGNPIRDAATGKIAYSTVFEFIDRQTRDAFSRAVWHAVEAINPDAGIP